MGPTRIFISHAGSDRPLADLLLDVLTRSGLPRGRIFYSSDRSTGIPAGQGSRAHLKETLAERPLVLSLVTTTFATRPMCWMELGAAWALDLPTFPIIVPPMTRERAANGLGDAQVVTLGTPEQVSEVFDDLHGRIAEELEQQLSNNAWNPAVGRFRADLPALPSGLGSPEPVSTTPGPADGHAKPVAQDDVLVLTSSLLITRRQLLHERLGPVIVGTLTNDSRTPKGSVVLSGTFYDDHDAIVGTTRPGLISDIPAQGSKTFRLVGREKVSEVARFEVQLDSER